MLKFFINLFCCLFITFSALGQQKTPPKQKTKAKETTKKTSDSEPPIVYKTPYGFRFGVDISRPIIAALDETFSWLELVAAYRIKNKLYLAAEFGFVT